MQGKLIVLEGIDGSGKSTQLKKLCDRLESEGRSFRRIIFPRYDNESSSLIRMYLRGDFGGRPADVNPYASSTFFAVDRYASFKTDWMDYYEGGGLVLSDRYTTSNAVHQGSKLPAAELDEFLSWLYDFEFRLLRLPKPDLVIYLDVDIKTALAQISSRQSLTNSGGDIHEADEDYLQNCLRAGHRAVEVFGWTRVLCIENGKMRGIEDVHDEIYDVMRIFL